MKMFKFLKVRRAINKFIRVRPVLFVFIMSKRKKFKDIVVNDSTEIVIEGYPRSANTFAVAAFNFSQSRKMSIARHTHAPAQIEAAVKLGLPVILLVREPVDAIISLSIRDESISLREALKTYVWYHESLMSVLEGCVVADFKNVTSDFSTVINAVNKKYKKDFLLFEHDKKSEFEIFKLVEKMEMDDSGGDLRESHVARPSAARTPIKADLKKQLTLPDNEYLLKKCYKLYNEIVG